MLRRTKARMHVQALQLRAGRETVDLTVDKSLRVPISLIKDHRNGKIRRMVCEEAVAILLWPQKPFLVDKEPEPLLDFISKRPSNSL